MKKRISILGSTGSIGTKTLDVIRDFSDRLEVVALTTHRHLDLLRQQCLEYRPRFIAVTSEGHEEAGRALAREMGAEFGFGLEGLCQAATFGDTELVMVATVGAIGVVPTLKALESGRSVALANKEVLVTAGDLVTATGAKHGATILPVDSEHNALAQCLAGNSRQSIRRCILTASGGPFRNRCRDEMASVTVADALKHPTWVMGPKITIDSATLMNKGFEVIEGCHLFNLKPSQFEVLIHPQSTVHSLVEFVDGSILAHLGVTDMYMPIQNVLLHPQRQPNKFRPLDLAEVGELNFERPDLEAFPCLGFAFQALKAGGTMPAVLNAANEVAVNKFLNQEIQFLELPEIIRSVMQEHKTKHDPDLEALQRADLWAREKALQYAVVN